VDHKGEKRYRAQYAFPGVELNDVAGRNYVKSMVEWNLPPLRFRRAGKPGFYLTLSGGYAFAFEDGRSPRGEAMVSLKLLK
jgi:hypothetical protein